ncbi:acyltransferase family protein [Chryseobacterium sp. FH1]|uniref:acyltransferase family protein n=1 Tax=Chryseobacterium sp. FH1 TaxID=1233951 RepID=UPI0004E2EAF6|nr:acyltransferase [Chryseobacterium sp. FH1]KFC18675.1 hypothetical protein IO90_16870 [Chryseobacterium sp. FH1]
MLNNLTGLRFYAALWVYLYHAIIYIQELDCLFLQRGYIGVDLFFILSGFILTYVYFKSFFEEDITGKKYWNFIVKRFAKIYPMHVISFIIVAIMLYVGKYFFHQKELKLFPELIPSILLMIHSWGINDDYSWNVPSWSISSEWFAYLFLFVPFAFIYKKNRKVFIMAILFIVMFFIFKWANTRDFSLDNTEKLTNFGLERLFLEFILGMLLGYCRLNFDISRNISLFIFSFSIISFLLLLYGNVGLNVDAYCVIPLCGLIFSLSYPTYVDFLFNHKLLIYLGNISFSFYIIQLIPFFILKMPFRWLDAKDLPLYPLAIFKTLSLIGFNLILAGAFYKYYEEPSRKFIVRKFLISGSK